MRSGRVPLRTTLPNDGLPAPEFIGPRVGGENPEFPTTHTAVAPEPRPSPEPTNTQMNRIPEMRFHPYVFEPWFGVKTQIPSTLYVSPQAQSLPPTRVDYRRPEAIVPRVYTP